MKLIIQRDFCERQKKIKCDCYVGFDLIAIER